MNPQDMAQGPGPVEPLHSLFPAVMFSPELFSLWTLSCSYGSEVSDGCAFHVCDLSWLFYLQSHPCALDRPHIFCIGLSQATERFSSHYYHCIMKWQQRPGSGALRWIVRKQWGGVCSEPGALFFYSLSNVNRTVVYQGQLSQSLHSKWPHCLKSFLVWSGGGPKEKTLL